MKRSFRNIMTIVFCLCIGCIGGYFVFYFINNGFNQAMAQGNQVEIKEEYSIAEVAQAYQDCCVSVRVMSKTTNEQKSLGSGVCVYSGGYIVTNYHVIASAISNTNYEVYIYLNKNQEDGHKSQILWANDDLDLAIIKSSYTDITYAKMKDRSFACYESEMLKIGEEVIAIGTPVEITLQNTTTFGRINGTERVGAASGDVTSTRVYEYLIQHQATINSGNSGGALIDSNGYLVGINSCSMVSDKNDNYVANINFAVPIYPITKVINGVVSAYESNKTYNDSIIKISCEDKNFNKYINNSYTGEGVLVTSNPYAYINSTAIIKDDVILAMTYNGQSHEITCVYDFYYNCLRAGSGTNVVFRVQRNGTIIEETSGVILP